MAEATNGIDTEIARKYLDLDRECEERILELQMENMNAQREVRDTQKRHFKSGVAEGLPKDAWKLALKLDRLDRKQERQRDNILEEEEEDTVDLVNQIKEALGEFGALPLGGAAIKAAEGDAAKPKGKGRRKGAKVTGDALVSAEPKGDALSSLIDDSVPEQDVGPAFLRDKEKRAAEANAAALEAGISELKH